MTDYPGQQAIVFDDVKATSVGSPPDALSSVNWDFPERVAQSDIEGIHPYPAKFVAEMPRALIDSLPIPPGTAVLDPFCGSGTTLVECQRRGIPTIGIDLNPIACLMSRVKTSPCPPDLEIEARKAVAMPFVQAEVPTPDIPNLDHWFRRPVQDMLVRLTRAIDSAPRHVRDCLCLALSSIVVRVSNQESDTRYAAIAKEVGPETVQRLFFRAIERIAEALRNRAYPLSPADVIEGNVLDIRREQIDRPVGLVVTSPPYPNAYEYWLYHKYRMWWLGFDPLKVKAQEIGARAHFFKKNHHTADDFARQMHRTFDLLCQIVVPNGYVCFVVGRSRIHGQTIDNAAILERVAGCHGFRRHFVAERTLPPQRKSFNLSHANIKTETILVFVREHS